MGLDLFLQSYFIDDQRVIQHLPDILTSLQPTYFDSPAQNSKWTNRINSLIHAKQPASRWAGLVLAHQTSIHSRDIMLEQSQGWIAIVLPILSRRESPACQAASVRLLSHICVKARDMKDFQRQVVLPIVPKFSAAMVALAESSIDPKFKSTLIIALGALLRAYPTAHRALHPSLVALCRKFLLENALLEAVISLYSSLPLAFGKTNAASQWRAIVDENIQELRKLHKELKGIYGDFARLPPNARPVETIYDLLARFRAHSAILLGLLGSPLPRHVTIPLGELMSIALELLKPMKDSTGTTNDEPAEFDRLSTSELWRISCNLLSSLVLCCPSAMSPYLHLVLSTICPYLESDIQITHKLTFMDTLLKLLEHCPAPHDSIILGRLLRIVLPQTRSLLPNKREAQKSAEQEAPGKQRKKKGTQYGEDIVHDDILPAFASEDHARLVLLALEVTGLLVSAPGTPNSMKSLACRVLIYLTFRLPAISAQTGGLGSEYLPRILCCVQRVLTDAAQQTTKYAANAQELSLQGAFLFDGPNAKHMVAELESSIHPSVPPLVGIPALQSLTLSVDEEGEEERRMRSLLNLETLETAQAGEAETRDQLGASRKTNAQAEAPDVPATPQPTMKRVEKPAVTIGGGQGLFSTPVPLVPRPMEDVQTAPRFHQAPPSEVHQPAPQMPREPENAKLVPQNRQSLHAAPMDEDDDDEPLPEINMESSSGEEED